MSLAIKLLRQVEEAKKAAADEMSVPTYDNMHTPDNHVSGTAGATKAVSNPAAGLGDRKDKKPTANVGSAGKESRDMEGVKGAKVKRKVKEATSSPVIDALGMRKRDGLLSFHHPQAPDQVISMELTPQIEKFLMGMLRSSQDPFEVYAALEELDSTDQGRDPRNRSGIENTQLAASKGGWPMAEGYENNPIAQALNLQMDGNMITMTAPDGSAALKAPASGAVRKALNSYLTNPAARSDTDLAATKLFQMFGQKVPGVQAIEPQSGGARTKMSHVKSRGVAPDAGSGMSLEPMNASVGESSHKVAHGEMNRPTIKSGNPAKTAKVRTKQNDDPTNKGNPGTSKEEKGVEKKQFTMSLKDFKGGENEHKTMKKMYENISSLENLLGRKLQLEGVSKRKTRKA